MRHAEGVTILTSVCFLFCLALGAGFTAAARGAVPVANGPYTASQAERGKVVYEQSCSACHGASLRGGANDFAAPALAGPFFYEKWSGRTLEELHQYATENMPPEGTCHAQPAGRWWIKACAIASRWAL